jgi:protein TonB
MIEPSLPHRTHLDANTSRARRWMERGVAAGLVAAISGTVMLAAPAFRPAKYLDGAIPLLPAPTVAGGGEVALELDVTSTGAVRAVRTLRSTPPYTDLLSGAVRMWRFTPAEVDVENAPAGQPRVRRLDSTVLVAAIFRAPALIGPTLGETARDAGVGLGSTPMLVSTVPPVFPALARDGGVVLLETAVDLSGRPVQPRVVRSSPPFDEPALMALRQWRFRPARVEGMTVQTLAYVIMGFPQPVTVGGPAPR